MRIIAGEYKGRNIKPVPGQETRPTGDKVKEAVFHRMGPYFSGGNGLDLFAGSGALGMEALSRGMNQMTFVDTSIQAIRTIHKNISILHIQDQCKVYRNDAVRALNLLAKKNELFHLILLDPPYKGIYYQPLLDKIEQSHVVASSGLIYVEHAPGKEFMLSKDYAPIFQKEYNKVTAVTIFQKLSETSSSD